MTLKKIIGKAHLWLGLASGAIVLLLSITGCIYVFEHEIFSLVHHDKLKVKEVKETVLPLSRLKTSAQQLLGADKPLSRIYTYNDPEKAWAFMSFNYDPEALTYFGNMKHHQTVYLDPYTGEATGVLDNKYEFFQIIKMLHWSLLLNTAIGQPITGYATLIFVILLITGIFLWWPRNKNARKQRFTIKLKSGRKRLNYDLHNVLGFYVSVLATIVACTGLIWALSWFKSSVYYVASGGMEAPQKVMARSDKDSQRPEEEPLDKIYTQLNEHFPELRSAAFIFPSQEEGALRVSARCTEEEVYYKNHQLQYDMYSARLLDEQLYEDKSPADKLMAMNYDIHVGAILGLPGKILAFLVSLFCASLPVTGLYIWLGRRRKSQKSSNSSRPLQTQRAKKHVRPKTIREELSQV